MWYPTPADCTALVSREKAETVLAAVANLAAWLDGIDPDSPTSPPLRARLPRGVVDHRVEGGAYDWPMYVPYGGTEGEFGARIAPTTVPDARFLEPVNGWCLGIYPADW